MKKAWLLSAALLAASAGAEAQTYKKISDIRKVGISTERTNTTEVNLSSGLPPVVSPKKIHHNSTATSFIFTPSVLGSSGNAYSQAFGSKAFLYADPFSGLIVHTHRSATAGGAANTGNILYDFSPNKGETTGPVTAPVSSWTNNNLAIATTTATGAARYPEGVVYNPNNAATAASGSSPYVFASPTLNGTNGAWGGFYTGAEYVGATNAAVTDISSSTATLSHLIPDVTWSTPFAVFTSEYERPDVAAAFVYNGNILVHRTNVTAGTPIAINTTTSKVAFPVTQMVEARISFSPDGSIGYLSMIADDTTNKVDPDLTLKLHTMITRDSGATWLPTIDPEIDITRDDNMLGLRNKVFSDSVYLDAACGIFLPTLANPANAKSQFTTGFTHDATVDKNGNLHVITEVASNGDINAACLGNISDSYSIRTDVSLRAMVHFWTEDQGATWKADTLGRRYTFREDVGDLACGGTGLSGGDGRPQVAMDRMGESFFFAWFDTDTTIIPSDCNNFPDFYLGGATLDANSPAVLSRYPTINASSGSGFDGIFTFGNISSQYVFDTTNVGGIKTFQIPVSYTQLSNPSSITAAVSYFYLSGAFLDDSSFKVVPTVWDGFSWSNGTPDSTRTAVIDGPYNTLTDGDIRAGLLVVNDFRTLSIRAGGTVASDGTITNNGSIVNCGGVITGTVTGTPVVTGIPTVITTSPMDQTVVAGQPVVFTVVGTGTNLTYQWRENGNDVGLSAGTYSIAAASPALSGNMYDVVLSGACGDATSDTATLTVTPLITIWTNSWDNGTPDNNYIAVIDSNYNTQINSNISAYQLIVNNDDTLFIDAGTSVSVVDSVMNNGTIINCAGTLTGTLTGNGPVAANPTLILTQPTDQAIDTSATATFSVAALGSNLTYEWILISTGATVSTSNSYTTPVATLADSGAMYVVIVSGTCGEVFSDTVTLLVTTGLTSIANTIAKNIEIYPNPAEDQLSVQYTLRRNAEVSVSVMNTLGQRVAGRTFGREATGIQQHTVDLSRLESGLYLVAISVDGQPAVTKKLMVK